MFFNNRVDDNLICTGSNKEIVEAFFSKEVEFLVVGGLAVAWYCSARQADDMDLLINPTTDNSRKVADILSGLHGVRDLEPNAFAKLGVQAQIKKYHNADIITPAEDWPSFEELMKKATPVKLFGISVKIPALEKLIQLKNIIIALQEKELSKHKEDVNLLKTALLK